MAMRAVFTIIKERLRFLLVLPCLGLMIGTAAAESGIRIKSGPSVFAGPANPACDATSTITFRVEIENTNCVCNEDVNPIKRAEFIPDLVVDKLNPLTGFDFLGFKTSPGGSLSPTLTFIDMEDETSNEFFFDVRTHPDGSGCFPFTSAEFGIVVCDGGGGCDWGFSSDLGYPICESPKLVPTVHIDADMTACSTASTGTGSIEGMVVDGTGQPVQLAVVTVSKGCFAVPGFVSKGAFSSTGWWPFTTPPGAYMVPNPGEPGLPPGTYTLKAVEAGRCTTQTVVLAAGEHKVLNLTLGPGPCP